MEYTCSMNLLFTYSVSFFTSSATSLRHTIVALDLCRHARTFLVKSRRFASSNSDKKCKLYIVYEACAPSDMHCFIQTVNKMHAHTYIVRKWN